MSETYPGHYDGGTVGGERNNAAAPGTAHWLCLAAAPTFALMALLTAVLDGAPDTLCSNMQHAPALGGMSLMYLLMSAFHAPPWLKLISGGRSGARLG